MGKLILGMNVSLDGYVDGIDGKLDMPPPSPELFRFWIDEVRGHAAAIYGRRMYEVMRYWDDDQADWDEARRDFAEAWRRLDKWVVSSAPLSLGPKAQPITGDIAAQVRDIKARIDGTISVSGPQLAGLMTEHGLIDEYQLVIRPYVLGRGKPFFHGARPPLRLLSHDRLDDETVRLAYRPA